MNTTRPAELAERGTNGQGAERPTVSLGLPVYNGAKFLQACLESISAQTYADFELIICDNASTDATEDIARRWCACDPRISYHRAPVNRGAARNFNWTVELARASLFKWCAVDDLLTPTMLSLCVAALKSSPDAVLAYSGALDIDDNAKVIGEIYDNKADLRFDSPDISRRFHDLALAGHSCISVFGVIRSEALRKTELIGVYPGSDHALLVQLGLLGRFIRLRENLLLHRQHEERSVALYPRLRDRAIWFAGSKERFIFPNFRLLYTYAHSMLGTEMPLEARTRCVGSLLRWIYWGGWRKLIGDVADQFL